MNDKAIARIFGVLILFRRNRGSGQKISDRETYFFSSTWRISGLQSSLLIFCYELSSLTQTTLIKDRACDQNQEHMSYFSESPSQKQRNFTIKQSTTI